MSDIQTQFEETVSIIKNSQSDSSKSNHLKLEFYALYKQATLGDASNQEKPGRFDMVGKAKYSAWLAKKGLEKESAMQAYIDLYNQNQ